MVDAEPHTPCCSSFETYGGSSNVFEKPRLNQVETDFGQTAFDLLCVVLCCVVLCCVVLCCVVLCCVLSVWRGHCFTVLERGFMCGCWFQGLVWIGTVLPLDRPTPGPALPLDRPSPGPPFPWTALPLDRPKFRSFFSLSRRKIRYFLPPSGVFSRNFGGV